MLHFLSNHGEILSVLALALIAAMPEELPSSVSQLPKWLYGWLAHGLKTFVSFRAPGDKAKPL